MPHFDSGAIAQTITFRLADSLPRRVYDSILTSSQSDEVRFRRLEGLIDKGRGACVLKQADSADTVENALGYFDGDRYRLLAWVIMPNHVHVLIEQIEGHPLNSIVHSWKSFTAKQINKIRGESGSVWAPDYHDRYIRNADHCARAVHYIEQNPVKAGLVTCAQDWSFSSARRQSE